MSQQLLTSFLYLDLAGVCPNSLDNEFISWGKKLYLTSLALLPTYFFLRVLEESYDKHQDIAAFLIIIGCFVFWINYLLVIITPALNPTLIVKFFRIVEEARETIASLGITQPERPSEATQLWYIGVFGIFPVVGSLLVWALYGTFYHITAIISTVLVNFAGLLKIKMMLLLLNGKFEVLNKWFKKVSDESRSYSSKTDFDIDSFLFKLHNIKCVKPKSSGSGITVDQILKFNQAHFQLCDAHKTLQSMFSLTALTETLFVCFFIIFAFTVNNKNTPLLVVVHCFTYSFLIMFLFISVLSSATDVKNNSLKTGYLVHELLNEELPFDVEEEFGRIPAFFNSVAMLMGQKSPPLFTLLLRRLTPSVSVFVGLQLFSRSLCLRKIGISAQGFFMIDLKLLTKMVCTLAPLVLIMVQRKHRAMKANDN